MPKTGEAGSQQPQGRERRAFLTLRDLSILKQGPAPEGTPAQEKTRRNHRYNAVRLKAMREAQDALSLYADLCALMDAEWVAKVALSGSAERGLHLERVVRESVGAVGWGHAPEESGGSGAFFVQHMAAAIQGGIPSEGEGRGARVEIRLPAVGFTGRTPTATGPTTRHLKGRPERAAKALREAARRAPRPRKDDAGKGGSRAR